MLYTSELYGNDRSHLPVFSSLALESKLSNIHSPSGDNVMLYLNDDMFLASEHTVSDFWNPVSGLNIQLDPQIYVPSQDASISEFQTDWNSEWTALRYSNYLLSKNPFQSHFLMSGKRFGFRRRNYLAHHGKALLSSILRELAQEFPDQLNETSSHRFRAESRDVNTIFLHNHYIIERHRELLLESFLVHRFDANRDGQLDIEEREALVEQIEHALAQRLPRRTLQEQLLGMTSANLPLPKVTRPAWASTDGHPFALVSPANPITEDNLKDPDQPVYTYNHVPHTRIPTFDFMEMCLTNDFIRESLSSVTVDAKVLFRLLAKEYPYCGDTLLSILIPAVPTGLHHILPPPSHPQYSTLIHQLHAHAYTISESNSEFIMAKNVGSLTKGFDRAMTTMKERGLAQICVNDDVEYADAKIIRLWDSTLRGILQGYFGGFTADKGKSPVEKAETVQSVNGEGNEFWKKYSRRGGPGY
jgi:hypothetical protein